MNRFVALVATGIAMLGPLDAANAFFVRGNQLYEWCTNASSPDACNAYVIGVIDKQEVTDGTKVFCVETHVTIGQASDVVREYLRQHPERRHHQAASLVDDALAAAFPCKDP
jgi:hypothetical protein